MDKMKIPRQSLLHRYLTSSLEALANGKLRLLAPGERRKRKPGAIPFYPLQEHPHIEMIFAPQPGVSVFVEDKWLHYTPGELWVFLPGTLHSERVARAKGSYDLLWFALTRRAFGLHMTAYRPRSGYIVRPRRLAFHPLVQEDLHRAAQALDTSSTRARIRFQSLVMQAMLQAQEELDRPDEPSASYQRQMVDLVNTHINAHYMKDLPLDRLAALVHYTPSHLNALFKKYLGKSAHQCLIDVRLREATRLLNTSSDAVKAIAFQVGFTDPLYFSRLYRKRYGVPPSAMRGVPDA